MKVATEKELWTKLLRPALHSPAIGRLAYKVQDAFVKGLPDVTAIIDGRVWWLELKVHPRPKRDTTPWRVKVTPEQRKWLKAWRRAGGNAAVVVYDPVQEMLFILDPDVPEAVPGGTDAWDFWAMAEMSLDLVRNGELGTTLKFLAE